MLHTNYALCYKYNTSSEPTLFGHTHNIKTYLQRIDVCSLYS